MSFPTSRKGCFKCGNLGHIAANCMEDVRLCYNCTQPGHETASCPSPRTVDAKQCYSCGGVGHIQSDCPTLRLQAQNRSKKCYNCERIGHVASNCPGESVSVAPPRGNPFGSGFRNRPAQGTGRQVTCFRCGEANHMAKNCLADAPAVAAYAATKPTGSKTCYNCAKKRATSQGSVLKHYSNLNILLWQYCSVIFAYQTSS